MTAPADVHEPRDPAPVAVRHARLTWIVGGSLLIAYAALRLAGYGIQLLWFPGAWYFIEALWAAALVLFAFGIRGAGSIVAKRPAGVVALVVAAVMPFVSSIVLGLLTPATLEPGYDPTLAVTVSTSLQALSLGALVAACVVIARAGAVPHHWRWVPLIALTVAAVPQVIAVLVMVSTPDSYDQMGMALLLTSVGLLGILAALVLGILAIVHAPRETPRATGPVQVYPPAPQP